ncbi:hypothetical protein HYT45_03960 [Candidatus Uhrbacteria bacterium]|nr:hypothetical protein [Candidatus Uhrbacteria bacterium]
MQCCQEEGKIEGASQCKEGACSPHGEGRWHNRWCVLGCLLAKKLLLLAGLVALVAAWVTERTGELFLGLDSNHLFHDALALLLLFLLCAKCGHRHHHSC